MTKYSHIPISLNLIYTAVTEGKKCFVIVTFILNLKYGLRKSKLVVKLNMYYSYLILYSTAIHRETVNGNSTLEKSFQITPLLANNKEKRGLSVDGRLKDEDTHLASTTL